MDEPLLNPKIQQFINEHVGNEVSKLALRKNPFPEADWISILNQIAAKSKAKNKLPTWFSASGIIYPSKISVEQTSSESTAAYKSTLISGDSLIDLTGGFGIDDYYFARQFEAVVHCEINAELSALVAHNFDTLGVGNIECKIGDSQTILQQLNGKFDWIYIDPSRRNDAKGKVFLLKDCLPDVPQLLDFYFGYSSNILVKTAPVLDIVAGLSELKNVKRIHIVALENEVKELLWEIEKGYRDVIEIKTANLLKTDIEKFDFILGEETHCHIGSPQKYLYEPNSAIMKSGAFEAVGTKYQLAKLHQHSHLYTSKEKIDFPGRIFEIEKVVPYQKNEMKALENSNANLTTRNFPETVEAIRKKWKIKDGGDRYCFFTTDGNNDKIVLFCTKIK